MRPTFFGRARGRRGLETAHRQVADWRRRDGVPSRDFERRTPKNLDHFAGPAAVWLGELIVAWSLVHGFAMLLLDERLKQLIARLPTGVDEMAFLLMRIRAALPPVRTHARRGSRKRPDPPLSNRRAGTSP